MMKQLITKQEIVGTSQDPLHNTQHARGISLISLIITIIVIIILAAIVIFTGLNTPDRANFAKFVSEFSDFRTAVQQDYMQKKAQYAIEGKTRSDAQIYYLIASKADASTITNINQEPTEGSEQYNGTEIKSLEDLGVDGLGIKGTYAYQIQNDTNVTNWKQDKKYYAPDETHWVTDEGDVFILKGYRVEQDGEEKWYLNETVASDTAISGPKTIQVGKAIVSEDTNGSTAYTTTDFNGSTLYIVIEASIEEGTVVMDTADTRATSVDAATSTSASGSKFVYSVSKNGTYTFTLAKQGSMQTKEVTVQVNQFDVPTLAKLVAENKIKSGDYVTYHGKSTNSFLVTSENTGWDAYGVSGDTTKNKIVTPTNTTWRVWKIHSDGRIDIVPTTAIKPITDNFLYLYRTTGFEYSLQTLDGICGVYANDGATARSMTTEDLLDPDISSGLNSGLTLTRVAYHYNGDGNQTGTTTYPATNGNEYMNYQHRTTTSRFYTSLLNGAGQRVAVEGIDGSANAELTMEGSGANYITLSTGKPVFATNAYWYGSTVYKYLVGNSGSRYSSLLSGYSWLASPCVRVRSESTCATFYVFYVNNGYVDVNGFFYSDCDTDSSHSGGVRPLVTLSSSLEISKTGSPDGTKDYPWVIEQ